MPQQLLTERQYYRGIGITKLHDKLYGGQYNSLHGLSYLRCQSSTINHAKSLNIYQTMKKYDANGQTNVT
jgi:hypothetical protein